MTKLITMILSCCFLLVLMPSVSMAAEVDAPNILSEEVSASVRASNEDCFIYNSKSSSMQFTITKNTSYFKYSSGSFGTTSYVMIRFTNNDTGTYCSHPVYGAVADAKINCNLTPGTYTVSFTTNEDAVGFLHIYFFK